MSNVTDRWLWVIVGLCLVVGLVAVGARAGVESAADRVELIMDLEEAEALARWWGHDTGEVLEMMRDRGLTSAGVPELTLVRLHESGRVTLLTGAELLTRAQVAPLDARLAELASVVTAPGYAYAICDDEDLATELVSRAGKRPALLFREWHRVGDDRWVLEFGGSHDALLNAGLGFDPLDAERVREAGLLVVPRPRNIAAATPADIGEMLAEVADGANLVIAQGVELPGYPDLIDVYGRELSDRGLYPGLVESHLQRGYLMQRGTDELARQFSYQVVRIYTIGRQELDRMTMEEAADRMVRSVRERNVRGLYLRPLMDGVHRGSELDNTLGYIEHLRAEVEAAGFVAGAAVPFPPFAVRPLPVMAAGLAVLAGALLVLRCLVSLSPTSTVLIMAGAGAAWLGTVTAEPLLMRQVMALAAAVSYPVLAMIVVGRMVVPVKHWRQALARGVGALVVASVISVAGGVLLTVLLGDSVFLLDFNYFRGVKLSFILPLAVYVLILSRNGEISGRRWLIRVRDQLGQTMSRHVSSLDLVMLAVLAVVLYLYIGRAGHEGGLPVPGAEVLIRELLQNLAGVRPRFKEFLIGHPALVTGAVLMGAGLIRRRWFWLLVGLTGQVSIVNSFAHLRTPFLLSLVRTGHGVWLGMLLGLLLVAGAALVARVAWGQVSGKGARP